MFQTIRSRLHVVIGLAVAILVALAARAAVGAWDARREAELAANLEVARTVAAALRIHVDDVMHEVGALGRSLASMRLSEQDANRLLAEATSDYVSVREFSWVNPDGRVASSSNPAAIGLSVADRDFYQRVVAGEDRVISDLFRSSVDGQAVVALARAIRPQGGAPAGTMIAVIAADRLGWRGLPLAREGTAAVVILDRAGRLVFRSPERPLDWAERAIDRRSQPLLAAALAGREAAGEIQGRAERRLGAAVPVAPFGWAVQAFRSADEAMGPLRRELTLLLSAGAIVSVLAVGAASLVGRRTASALRRLERHAEAFARGRRPRKPLRGPAEIVDLGHAYERMADGLLAAQRRFRTVFDETPAGVLVLDPTDLRVLWANRAAVGVAVEPFRSEGLVGHRLEEVSPGATAGFFDLLRAVARGEGPHEEQEYRFDGERGPMWWNWSARTIPADGGGQELLLLGSDVTYQVTARARLDADRRRLETVLETLPAGVLISDVGGALLQANDEARRIWGRPIPLHAPLHQVEVRARFVDDGHPVEARDWPTERALATGRPVPGRLVELERAEGDPVTILTGGQPILDAEGRVCGAVATALDVSELRRAVRRRDDVLRIVSHDLRTPLATVMLGAAALRRLPDGPGAAAQARRAAERLAAAGKRMTRLIDDLLDLESLDAGRLSLRRSPCDPADLLGAAADELREAAREKGLELRLSAPPGLPAVEADRDRVLQVLGNVASNAVKATGAGTVSLAAEDRGDVVAFRIRDTGPGIPAEELPHVFDWYHRGAGAAWRGSGLGLAIARALVEAHGGAIHADSAPGEGTTVTFTLPVARRAGDGAQDGAEEAAGEPG